MKNQFIITKKIVKFIDKIQSAWNSLMYKLMFKKYK